MPVHYVYYIPPVDNYQLRHHAKHGNRSIEETLLGEERTHLYERRTDQAAGTKRQGLDDESHCRRVGRFAHHRVPLAEGDAEGRKRSIGGLHAGHALKEKADTET